MLSIGTVASAAQGASYYEKDGYYAKDDPEHRDASAWFGKGAEGPRALGARGPRHLPRDPRGEGAGRVRDRTRQARQGRRDHAPAGARPHALGAQIGLDRGPRGGRRADRRRPRPGGEGDARLGREERRRDPDAGPRDRPHGPGRRSEDRRRDLPPRHLAQPRPAAPHALGARQHGAGGGRQVAHDGQREALRLEDADRRDLPERARGRADQARVRHREDPCRRPLRDRGRLPRGDSGVLHAPGRDRGGHGRARARHDGGQPAPCRAGGADDARHQAGGRSRRAPPDLATPGRRPGPRRRGVHARGRRCGCPGSSHGGPASAPERRPGPAGRWGLARPCGRAGDGGR